LVIAADYVNLENFTKGLEILLSEIQLLQTSLYLNEKGKEYTILQSIFTNSILIDQIIQKTSKSHLYFSGRSFANIDRLFAENKIDQLLKTYDQVPRITQSFDHLNDFVYWYIAFVVALLVVVIALAVQKSL
jgi:hypothetical protein